MEAIQVNDIKENIKNKEDFLKIYKKEYIIYEYIYLRKASGFRFGLFNQERSITNNDYKPNKLLLEFVEFIKSPNVFITNDDWSILYNNFKDDKKNIIIFDPPYLSTCNSFYENATTNVYEYLYENNIKKIKEIYT